jgi:hypothetical protein
VNEEPTLPLFKNMLSYLGQYELKDFLEYLRSAITIIAFLMAVEYFTPQASLKISEHTMHCGFYPDSIVNYYQEHKIEFPKRLIEDQSLHGVFPREVKQIDRSSGPGENVGEAASEEMVVAAIAEGQPILGYIEHVRIGKLESQIGKYTYAKQVYLLGDDRLSCSEEDFKRVLARAKSLLSPKDYYILLVASLRSRENGQSIYVNNDGDLDLKNVTITIPAPLSKVTDSRRNNILVYSVVGDPPNEVVNDGSGITLHLPSLKKGWNTSLEIVTRENRINADEIVTSYERDKPIRKGRVFLYFVLTLVAMLVLKLVFKGRTPGAVRGG